jgi:hypothetical protein
MLTKTITETQVERAAAEVYEAADEPTFASHVINMTPAMEKFLAVFEDDDGEDLVTELAQCAYAGPNQRLAFVERWVGKLEERWERRRSRP